MKVSGRQYEKRFPLREIFAGKYALMPTPIRAEIEPDKKGRRALFRKMDVIINMILAETVVPGAAGTVAEFKIRIVCISSAADSAFVMIGF